MLSKDKEEKLDTELVKVVRCYKCKFYRHKESVCIRKIKFGGIHAADKVSKNFYCACGVER